MAAVPLGFAIAAVKLGYYGNWGGWGWSGREIFPPKIDRTVGVKDALDQTFKDHDIRYEDADEKLKNGEIDKATHRELINDADKQLLRDMDALDLSSLPNSAEAEGMRARARGYFEREVEKYENPSTDDTCDLFSGEPIGSCSDIPPTVSDNFTGAENFIRRRDPLTFDLDGDGIETIGIDPNNPILFDHDGDGLKTATGWISADDAFLVLDRNSNGTIDNGTELFGDSTPLNGGANAADGFAALTDQDSNHDGKVDSNDANFARLRLWQDLNQDGISQAGELFTLNQKGIASITVAKTENSTLLPNGNVLADLGHYTKTDGSEGALGAATGQLGDVDLRENTFFSQFTDAIPLTPEAQLLPTMHGSGQVRDLREAVSLSPDLAQQLAAYSQATTRAEQLNQLDTLIQGWSGTSTMPTTATGAYGTRPLTLVFEGIAEGSAAYTVWLEKLSVLERFNGRTFRPIPADLENGDILLFRNRVLPRPPARAQARLQPQAPGRARDPGGRAEGRGPVHAVAQGRKLHRRLRGTHPRHPVPGQGHWAFVEKRRSRARQARPVPVLGALHQLCPQRIALDIAQDG